MAGSHQQKYSEYSPAYSPSLGTSHPGIKSDNSDSKGGASFYQPAQSPLYQGIQSPVYQESNEKASVAYNPASPQYSLNQKVRRSKRNASKIQGSIKEEHNEHSD